MSHIIIDKSKIKTKYRVGIVAHYADMDNSIFEKIHSKIQNSIIININQNPIDFLNQISECETIMSTAMHPLIASDALKIPNLWIRISEKTTSYYKFEDYYSVFDIEPKPFDPIRNLDKIDNSFPEFIKKNYSIDEHKLKIVQNNLLQAKTKLEKDLKSEYFKNKIIKKFPIKKIKVGNFEQIIFFGIKLYSKNNSLSR